MEKTKKRKIFFKQKKDPYKSSSDASVINAGKILWDIME
jgi:hypothetical protein